MSGGLLKLVADLVEAVESHGLGVQVLVGLFAPGFFGTLAVREQQRRGQSD